MRARLLAAPAVSPSLGSGTTVTDPSTNRRDTVDSDRIEGKAKKAEGGMQEKWGEAKDKARDSWEDVKDKAEDIGDDAEDRVDERDESVR